MTIHYMDRPQTIRGWLQDNIFICKGDSLTSKQPWYAFHAATGQPITDREYNTRADALFYAELALELEKTTPVGLGRIHHS